tara:strand:+ start:2041 stop:2367 length:327 start_codon:yes stop_codon:yes gene_type:complete
MSWKNILKARSKASKIIGSALRQTISNHLEETGRKDVYEFEEIISLFPKYIEISEQDNRTALKMKFEETVMKYIPEGYGKLRELHTDKQGYAIPSSINTAITGWQKLK